MNRLLAQAEPNEIIGKINPVVNDPMFNSPTGALGNIIATGIRLFILFAAFIMLGYLLWGALDWITAQGDKEKLEQARHKITNAIIGMIMIVASLAIFSVVTGNILGIIKQGPNGWEFTLPRVGGNGGGSDATINCSTCGNTNQLCTLNDGSNFKSCFPKSGILPVHPDGYTWNCIPC